MKNDCPLCKREEITRKYCENNKVWVVDCKTCGVPMIVWKEHKPTVTDEEKAYMVKMANILFDMRDKKIDDRMRSLPDHYHMHIRG